MSVSFGLLARILALTAILGFSPVHARDLPTAHTPDADIEILYDDWNHVLQSSVMVTGRSDRKKAIPPAGSTGSNITYTNQKATRYEGNRVFYHVFDNSHTQILIKLRKSLETVSDEISLTELSRNEQLAYWLNLHNVAVMAEISEAYPVKIMKGRIRGTKKSWRRKTMRIAGEPTSILDIRQHVIENWDNPLVLYGFYLGAVGGPNIRNTAFTGKTLRRQLTENAQEFTSSLRGIQFWGDTASVSELYKIGARLFPDFQQDIKAHFHQYADPAVRSRMATVTKFKTDQFDWHIADLYNGVFTLSESFRGLSSPGTIHHARGDRNRASLRMPAHAMELVQGIRNKNARLNPGRVTIEKVEEAPASEEATDKQEEPVEID